MIRPHRALLGLCVAAACLAVLLQFSGRQSDPAPPLVTPPRDAAPTLVVVDSGLTPAQRDQFHHLPIGSELFPLPLLQALEDADTGRPFLENPERLGMLQDPDNADGLAVGMTVAPSRANDHFGRMVGFNCSVCHTAEMTYHGVRVQVDGAPSRFNQDEFLAAVTRSLKATLQDPKKLCAFLCRVQQRFAANDAASRTAPTASNVARDEANSAALPSSTLGQTFARVRACCEETMRTIRFLKIRIAFLLRIQDTKSDEDTAAGPGRSDTWLKARNVMFPQHSVPTTAPANYPHLWGYRPNVQWLTWTGCTQSGAQRDVATAIGAGAFFHPETYESTVSVAGLMRADQLIESIERPAWPVAAFGPLDETKRAAGKLLYDRHCADCHDVRQDCSQAEVGTDAQLLAAFCRPVGEQKFHEAFAQQMERFKQQAYSRALAAGEVTADEIAEFERCRPNQWRETESYVAWPLDGVWATAPYLHNGSVPTLYHLLLPPDQRPTKFHLGHRDYDPRRVGFQTQACDESRFEFDTTLTGNGNGGHAYGTQLTEDQRMALLEYLKGK